MISDIDVLVEIRRDNLDRVIRTAIDLQNQEVNFSAAAQVCHKEIYPSGNLFLNQHLSATMFLLNHALLK
jgi:hypothetical protein